MNETEPPPEQGGGILPQIPGLPPVEQDASNESASVHKAWAEMELLSQNSTPEELEQDAVRREHDRNQRFRHHFELIAIIALWLTAGFVVAIGAVWLWHMAAPLCWRWLSSEDVSHLQSIMTAGLLVGVIGNHFKKRMG
ncbi:hypothetical protein [Novosphingobium sp.]|uniref:hypothetical protein n=1 Tax=Novosphingobium sp. TaxID=1874826 RepID=UPI002B4A4CD1|nr:hypothetical protein [Novosphingobium sp.]HKR91371.1 hypothetical protein [Novosphingobium sp.]